LHKLWKIKHWLKYEPQIVFWKYTGKFLGFLVKITDKFGYWLYGKEKWETLKEENSNEMV